jgi:Cu/Ag efflux protein CusF
MTTSKAAIMVVGVVVVGWLGGCSTKSPSPQPQAAVSADTARPDDGTVRREDTTTVRATVKAINHKTRTVTLRGEDGQETTFVVDEAVKNLPQVRKGDIVTAQYHRALAARIVKQGEGKPGYSTGGGIETAEPGEKPAGVSAETVQVTATVTKIDRRKQEITLRGPRGKSVVVAVKNPANIEKLKKGDLVEITYTEAVAISVDKASR